MSKLTHHITNFDGLGDCFRKGGAVLSLTSLVLDDRPLEPAWSAQLILEDQGKAFISIKASSGTSDLLELAPVFGSEYPRYDKLTALLDHQVEVEFVKIRGRHSKISSGQSATIKLSFNQCNLVCCNAEEQPESIKITAILPGSSLRCQNDNTTIETLSETDGELGSSEKLDTLTGRIGIYRYRVYPQEDDLKIVITTARGEKSLSQEVDQKFYEAFLEAFRWVNGGSQYVYWVNHRRGYHEVNAWCQSPKIEDISSRLISSQPFNDKVPLFLETFVDFTGQHQDRFEELRTYLWQYRDAVADTHVSWGKILQLASFNEGITRLILRYHCGYSSSKQKKLLAPIDIDPDQSKGSAKARFYHALKVIGFEWDDFAPAYEAWKESRNPLAHGNFAPLDDWHGTKSITTYRILVNSFNWLTLRFIGFPKEKINLDNSWFPLD